MPIPTFQTLAILAPVLALAVPAQATEWGAPVPEAGAYADNGYAVREAAPAVDGSYQVAFNDWYGGRTYPAPPPPRQVMQPGGFYVPNQGYVGGGQPRYQPYGYGAQQAEPQAPVQRRQKTTTSRRGPAPEFQKAVVAYNGPEAPGTVVVDTPSRYLYLVQGDGTAIRYGIGVGKPGFEFSGEHEVTAKREWPDWRPPAEMRQRRPELPVHMAGGPNNPLGARALYLGSTLYRIHGSNEPWSIGHAVSSGCIRMTNDDVIDLYTRVPVGAKVIVI
jgi:lipoprotein-anchoring transpeptidase ErfK/SrfK